MILCGFKACGKTTLGKEIAGRLHRPFYDIDILLEERTGLKVADLHRRMGSGFRDLESETVRALPYDLAVIATGGGTLLRAENVAELKRRGTLIYLRTPKSVIRERLLRMPLPSFFDESDFEGSFERMWNERLSIFERECDLVADLGEGCGQ